MPIAKLAAAIMERHKVDSFVGSCLGGALGRLIDYGVSDDLISVIVTDLIATIHEVAGDPVRRELFQQLFGDDPDSRPIAAARHDGN